MENTTSETRSVEDIEIVEEPIDNIPLLIKEGDDFVGGKSLVGAAAKNLRKATGEKGAGVVDLNQELGKIEKKKGGEWTMWDLLRLHGESCDHVEKEMQDEHKRQAEEEKEKK